MNSQLYHLALIDFPILIAEAGIEGSVEKFYGFLKIVLNLVALVLVIWSGLKFSEGHVREGIQGLIGAFVVLLARVIVGAIAGTAS